MIYLPNDLSFWAKISKIPKALVCISLYVHNEQENISILSLGKYFSQVVCCKILLARIQYSGPKCLGLL